MLNPLNYLYICFVVSGTLFPGLVKITRPSRKSGSTSSPLSLVTVTFKGTAAGGQPIFSSVTEQIWKEGEVRKKMCFSLLRVLVAVSREDDFLLILHGSVQQKERLARKQLLSDVVLSYPQAVPTV